MRHPFADIPELSLLEAGRGLVRIPMEQDVPFTPRVRSLVDTAEFQRLGRISQLGLASRVYPGATHTRFEHALGVFHNALKYLWQLGKDPRFCEAVDVHTAEILIAAALLHDLGHWPFCHPIEDMDLPELPPHEQFAAQFLSPKRELAQVLTCEWNIQPDEVLDVLAARSDAANMRLIRSILSGPIDIDKMDYLDRDSLHAGVPYGRNFDKSRLMQSLLVNAAVDGLAISSKGKTAAELMVFARYVMFSEVYWHHAVRSATAMFARAFFDLRGEFDLAALFQLSEPEMIERLRNAARGTASERLIEGVFGSKRSLYKRAAEFSHYQSRESYERLAGRPYEFLVECASHLAERLSSASGEAIGRTDLLIDAPPPHREIEFAVDIYFPKEDVYRPLCEVSPVVDALAQRQFDDYVKRVRIFATPHVARRISGLPGFAHHLDAAISACE
ncbi:MAG: HD domain-containing protein [Planctomycetaceae bacterium]